MTDDRIFIKMFNYGYELQKAEPELADKLVKGFVDRSGIRKEGFVAGVEQARRERQQELDAYLREQREAQNGKIRPSDRSISSERQC